MHSITYLGGVVYHHIHNPHFVGGKPTCECGFVGERVHTRAERNIRNVQHVDLETPTRLLLYVPRLWCDHHECEKRTFVPKVEEAPPYSRNSTLLRERAVIGRREDRLTYQEASHRMERDFKAQISPSAICKWTLTQFPGQRLPLESTIPLRFSSVLCIDEVFPSVGGGKVPTLVGVDPIAEIALHFVLDRSDTEGVKAALSKLKELGADPDVIVSDLDKAYPGAISAVFPRARRQLCWFHVMQIVQKHLNRIFIDWRKTLPKADKRRLWQLRGKLLSGNRKLSLDDQALIAEILAEYGDTLFRQARQIRDDLQDAFNEGVEIDGEIIELSMVENAAEIVKGRVQKIIERKGEFLNTPVEKMIALFEEHLEEMVTYLYYEGVPRSNYPAEHECRKIRALEKRCYGWANIASLQRSLSQLQRPPP